ncbi:MAG TPA: tetratricopeptide repeat protein [Acidobacteriota bacterium]
MSTHRTFPIRFAVLAAALAAVVAAPSGWSVAAPVAGVAAAVPPTATAPGPGVAPVSAAATQEAKLGTIEFPTSGSAEAQPHFIRGVLLLHSFEYEDAATAFREAQRLDPDFALAYWGEAMTYNHPLWAQQDRDAALEALARLAPTPEARAAEAGTDKERAWLAAVEALYGEGDKQARDYDYRDAMRRMHESYPGDHEVTAFYALSWLGTSHGGRDFAKYMRAAALAEPVFDENPDHPGAAHYLIHSYDDPIHAPLGLPAARAYSKIAPAAAHAQHMTSHIFVATGMWDDVVAANEVARDVQNARLAELGRPPVDCGHYNSWLQYGYLQLGQIQAATREMTVCREALQEGSGGSAAYFANMRARQVLDTGDWALAAKLTADVSGSGGARANYNFTTGFAALKLGDLDTARRMAASLEGATEGAPILALELDAMLALEDGKIDEALAGLREATALEESLPFEFGPPAVIKPTHELLGEVLLQLERYDEAVAAFEQALARAPRRTPSLVGLAHAAAGAGDTLKADEVRAELHEIWRNADPGFAAAGHGG